MNLIYLSKINIACTQISKPPEYTTLSIAQSLISDQHFQHEYILELLTLRRY